MTFKITEAFKAAIGEKQLNSYNEYGSSVYGLDPSLKITYLNPAWFKFAEENDNRVFDSDSWPLGNCILDSIPDALKSFYKNLYESALHSNESSLVSKQSEYECSSPKLYRRFSMHLHTIGTAGIIVINSLSIEEPHKADVSEVHVFDSRNYIGEDGVLVQCANCRRIKRLGYSDQWDWVPKYIEQIHPNTSHGVCFTCMQHYYLGDM